MQTLRPSALHSPYQIRAALLASQEKGAVWDTRRFLPCSTARHGGADIEGVLRPAIAGTLAVELAGGFLVRLGLLESQRRQYDLRQTIIGTMGLARA
jgi:hypothetical protein